MGCAQHYVTEAVAKDPSSTPHVESLAGGLKSATILGHHHIGADQLSLASDPTSGKSAVSYSSDFIKQNTLYNYISM